MDMVTNAMKQSKDWLEPIWKVRWVTKLDKTVRGDLYVKVIFVFKRKKE